MGSLVIRGAKNENSILYVSPLLILRADIKRLAGAQRMTNYREHVVMKESSPRHCALIFEGGTAAAKNSHKPPLAGATQTGAGGARPLQSRQWRTLEIRRWTSGTELEAMRGAFGGYDQAMS